MSAAEYQDAGRLSRKRLTGLLPFGWSLKSPSAKGRLTIAWRGLPLGEALRHPRRAGAWHPLGCSASRERHAGKPIPPPCGRLAALDGQCCLRQQWALGARRLSLAVVFFLLRVSPLPFFATVARLHPAARVRFAQSSPGPALRSGCGFRAGPCIWAPPGSFSRNGKGLTRSRKNKGHH